MGFSSWKCPMCELPILAIAAGGEWLCHIALVCPSGETVPGIYDGYGRLLGAGEGVDLWPLIQVAEEQEPGWGDGDGIVVHQACLAEAEALVKNGETLPEMQRDPGQGFFYRPEQIAEMIAQQQN